MSDVEEEEGDADAIREADADPALAERLDVPASPRSIYLEEASVYRPILTGDIFRGVPVPGSTAEESAFDLTMIVSHPSVMREGPRLASRAQGAPIFPIGGVRRSEWSPKRFDIFPLPCLHEISEANSVDGVPRKPWAADLRLSGPIDTTQLDVTKRVACLSIERVLLLLQRLVHTDTRAAVRLDTLESVFMPKLNEVELLENWTEAALSANPPEDLGAGLAQCAEDFDAFLDTVSQASETAIREMLGSRRHQTAAQRLIEAEIAQRFDAG